MPYIYAILRTERNRELRVLLPRVPVLALNLCQFLTTKMNIFSAKIANFAYFSYICRKNFVISNWKRI